ncbi:MULTISPECIES: response regulator [unclassified Oceanispirochaeta]|uniref:response regulator n=1 Tax=unclassified Oceanispirochaeta TaxID=2635722 RepID=UPI000E09DCA1|nr:MULTISPECIES: response regulator [unclassified Oceanispirochaeta]MBF9018382.1 response regulator [Oceanispirochaeta sp. M2]NPD75204.1 hybrid sensor histidine kinase/response regulator [Oceanispirochaeta sp. M1]RDG28954.1 response regulator [Oceanispirochaeta sp. M1]
MTKKKILIVDDTLANLQLLGSILKDLYSLSFCSHGKEALDLLEKDQPDLILLDIMMPDMDGFELCTIIRTSERTSQIPIVFLSAKNDRESVIKGMSLGAQDYIVKPFLPEEVLYRIKLQFPKKNVPRLSENARSINNTSKVFLYNRMRNMQTCLESKDEKYADTLSSIEEDLDPLVSLIPDLLIYTKELEEFILQINLKKPDQIKELEEIQKRRVNPELTSGIHTLHENLQDCQFRIIDVINELNPGKSLKIKSEIPSLKKLLIELIERIDNKVELKWKLENDLMLPFEKVHLIQILLSLFDNSYDAMKEENSSCSLEVEIKNWKLIFTVEDNGPGIPEDAFETIFELGFSSKTERIGYGLHAVELIVENHFYGKIMIPYPDKGIIQIEIPLS